MENRADYFVQVNDMEEPILIEEAYLSNDHNYTIFKYADQLLDLKRHILLKNIQKLKNGIKVILS